MSLRKKLDQIINESPEDWGAGKEASREGYETEEIQVRGMGVLERRQIRGRVKAMCEELSEASIDPERPLYSRAFVNLILYMEALYGDTPEWERMKTVVRDVFTAK